MAVEMRKRPVIKGADEMASFVQNKLYCVKTDIKALSDDEMAEYLKVKLNRPMRVAGVVKNVGEPGGGPFLAYNQDGTYSLQILESSQIDKSNEQYVKYFTEGTQAACNDKFAVIIARNCP